jgi:predicted PurR-regulated permease PerM
MYNQTIDSLLKWMLLILVGSLLLRLGAILFIPMLFGLLIAFVVYPICLWLENHDIPKYAAITLCLSIIFILLFLLVLLLNWQLQLFSGELPQIAQKLNISFIQTQRWLHQNLNVTIKMQDEWIHTSILNSSNKFTAIVNTLFSAISSTLFMLFLAPVYTVLFLYHRSTFVSFMIVVLGKSNEIKIRAVLQEIIFTYSRFIKGMLLVYIIVGILNSIGLFALGIQNALLFGMLTAIMTIIPYIGIIISSLLPITIAYITKDSIWYSLGVILVFAVVQYLEANVIFPKVVGKQLNLSTWATLIAIIAGGIIWDVAGMILFIPMMAVLKIAAQNIPQLEAMFILLKRNE